MKLNNAPKTFREAFTRLRAAEADLATAQGREKLLLGQVVESLEVMKRLQDAAFQTLLGQAAAAELAAQVIDEVLKFSRKNRIALARRLLQQAMPATGDPVARAAASQILAELARELPADLPAEVRERLAASLQRARAGLVERTAIGEEASDAEGKKAN